MRRFPPECQNYENRALLRLIHSLSTTSVITNHRPISASKEVEIEQRLVITLVVGSERVKCLRKRISIFVAHYYKTLTPKSNTNCKILATGSFLYLVYDVNGL